MKTGVIICECQGSLARGLAIEEIRDSLPKDVVVETHPHLCGSSGRECLANLKSLGVERIIVGACTPRLFMDIFHLYSRSAGFSPGILERVNLREQCAWVTPDRAQATEKAITAISGMLRRKSPENKILDMISCKSVIIIGAGTSGISAAKLLPSLGYHVTIVERSSTPGGSEAGASGDSIIEELKGDIELLLSAQVVELRGQAGAFKATLACGNERIERTAGALLFATGFECRERCESYAPEVRDRILGFRELSKLSLEEEYGKKKSSIAIYLDEISEMAPFHFSIALKKAREERERGNSVYVIYRNMKVAYDEGELLYRRARKEGVIFFRVEEEPAISGVGDKLQLMIRDTLTWLEGGNANILLNVDYLIIPEAPVPGAEASMLSGMGKFTTCPSGFFQEDNVSLSPLFSNRPGIFFAGACLGPRSAIESLKEGAAAASEIHSFLTGAGLPELRAQVSPELCAMCLTCVRSCPHKAVEIDYSQGEFVAGAAKIEASACRGCGICVAECPARAIKLYDCEAPSGVISGRVL